MSTIPSLPYLIDTHLLSYLKGGIVKEWSQLKKWIEMKGSNSNTALLFLLRQDKGRASGILGQPISLWLFSHIAFST